MNNYFSRKSTLCAAALGATFLALLTGCQDEEFGYTADQIKYERNFTQKYGEIPGNKNWDLSTIGKHYENGGGDGTRAGNATLTENTHYSKNFGYWEVPMKTVRWMEKALIEGNDNRYLGSSFILQFPDNDFAIIPIYQGRSGINSELEVKINGYNIQSVWGRSEGFLINDKALTESEAESLSAPTSSNITSNNNTWDSTNKKFAKDNKWHTLGYYNGVLNATDYENSHRGTEEVLADGTKGYVHYPTYACYTDEAHRIMTKPILFKKEKIASTGHPYMYLSLHNTGKHVIENRDGVDKIWDTNIWLDERGANVWTTIGDRLTSINPEKRMLAINIPSSDRPSPSELPNLGNGKNPSQVIMVACEDANGIATDNDVNDVVFLLVGYPNAPTIIPTKEVIKKRYMCEDLGATDDFDFNDIVIDVTQTMEYELVTAPANMENETFNDRENPSTAIDVEIDRMIPLDGKNGTRDTKVQTAKLTHVCGTLPFRIQVGDFLFPWVNDPTHFYGVRSTLADDNAYQCLSLSHASHATRSGDSKYENGHKIGWNPNEERIICGNTWNPETNNIKVIVDWTKSGWPAQKGVLSSVVTPTANESEIYGTSDSEFADLSNGRVVVVNFPKPGNVPYIIATDQDVPWMKEREDIPTEWVTTGDITARNGNQATAGSNFYMENYNQSNNKNEGYIWEGEVTGLANTTGVEFKPGSPEVLAIAQAYATIKDINDPNNADSYENNDSWHGFYLLKVYTEDMGLGEDHRGYIGLKGIGTNGWEPLTANDPDGYIQGGIQTGGYLNTDGLRCTTIYLTPAQFDAIVGNDGLATNGKGLVVTSLTNGLVIRRISMQRPPIVDESNKNGTADAGYLLHITVPTVNSDGGIGSIKAMNHRERIVTDRDDADQVSRARIPFGESKYQTNEQVILTAVPDRGNILDHWVIDGTNNNNSGASNPNILTLTMNSNHTVTAVFAHAEDPQLTIIPNNKNNGALTTDTTLTITKGSTFSLQAVSRHWRMQLDTYGGDPQIATLSARNGQVNGSGNTFHWIDITGVETGTTEFVAYLRDGIQEENGSNVRYGASDELHIKVNVVEGYPTLTTTFTNENMYHAWSHFNETAYITEWAPNHDVVIGDGSVTGRNYVDLSSANVLVATVGRFDNFRFLFNRQAMEGNGDYLEQNSANEWQRNYMRIVNVSGNKRQFIIDLKAMRTKEGKNYTHLNAIKGSGEITLQLDNYACQAETDWETIQTTISTNTTDAKKLGIADIFTWHEENRHSTEAQVSGRDEANYIWCKTGTDSDIANGDPVCGYNGGTLSDFIDLTAANFLIVKIEKSNDNKDGLAYLINRGCNGGWDTPHSVDVTLPINNGSQQENSNLCHAVKHGDSWYYVLDLRKHRSNHGINYSHLNGLIRRYADLHAPKVLDVWSDSRNSPAVAGYKEHLYGTTVSFTDAGVNNDNERWMTITAGDISKALNYSCNNNVIITFDYHGVGEIPHSFEIKGKDKTWELREWGGSWNTSICSFDATNEIITFTISKSDFETYFQGIGGSGWQSHFQFGKHCKAPTAVHISKN